MGVLISRQRIDPILEEEGAHDLEEEEQDEEEQDENDVDDHLFFHPHKEHQLASEGHQEEPQSLRLEVPIVSF